jgi:hypothetical protein
VYRALFGSVNSADQVEWVRDIPTAVRTSISCERSLIEDLRTERNVELRFGATVLSLYLKKAPAIDRLIPVRVLASIIAEDWTCNFCEPER